MSIYKEDIRFYTTPHPSYAIYNQYPITPCTMSSLTRADIDSAKQSLTTALTTSHNTLTSHLLTKHTSNPPQPLTPFETQVLNYLTLNQARDAAVELFSDMERGRVSERGGKYKLSGAQGEGWIQLRRALEEVRRRGDGQGDDEEYSKKTVPPCHQGIQLDPIGIRFTSHSHRTSRNQLHLSSCSPLNPLSAISTLPPKPYSHRPSLFLHLGRSPEHSTSRGCCYYSTRCGLCRGGSGRRGIKRRKGSS